MGYTRSKAILDAHFKASLYRESYAVIRIDYHDFRIWDICVESYIDSDEFTAFNGAVDCIIKPLTRKANRWKITDARIVENGKGTIQTVGMTD